MRELDFLRVVIDDLDACPYLPDQIARMPLCFPTVELTPSQFDLLLAAGYRRSGDFFYRTRCPLCDACEPLRLDIGRFAPSRTQRRVWKRGNEQLQSVIDQPKVDAERVRLFNLHRHSRQLDHGHSSAGEIDYRRFLLNSTLEVLELSLWHEGRLIAVSITDFGAQSLSAVYCFFDPRAAQFSPGTFAILKQIELAQATQRTWLYLGLYVAANRHLNYKARYLPHQRLVQGHWQDFSRDDKK